jgi:hypothetical protein
MENIMGQIWNDGYGGSVVGFVDPDGKVWTATGGGHGSVIGFVDPDGKVYTASGGGHGSIVGFVDPDGKVYTASGGGHGSVIGRIDSSGKIWNNGYGGSIIARAEGGGLAGGAALLLFDLNSSKGPEEKPGCLGMIFKFIAFCVRLFKTWSGRVGMLLGVIAGIAMASQVENFVNALFLGIFSGLILLFIGGGLGTLVGFIFRKSSKTGKFGGLIGAGALVLAGVILGLVEHTGVNEIIMFVCVGLAVGWVLGTIIGAIVGLIRKQIARGKQSQ